MVIGIDASRAVTGQRTGTEAYAYFLIQALMPMAAEKGYRIRLYFNQPPPDRWLPQADHVEEVVIPFRRLWTHARLARELNGRPPDVFFTPAHIIPYSYRGPSVATVHDLGYSYFPEAHTRRQVAYLRWSTRHNGRRSRRVIADSSATKEDLQRLYDLNPAKIDVIYPGIDPNLRPVTDAEQLAEVQDKYGLTPPYLLYIGTLQPRKNLARLVDAYISSNVPHQLVLAGKAGWRARSLLNKIESLDSDIRERILMTGYVANEEKAALISGAETLLFPSLYEGFGFPVIEGNACGTPVLCSNTSSLPEVAGDAALKVDPLDTEALATGIRRVTADEVLKKRLVMAGKANIRRFTWERTANDVLATLERAGV